MIKGTQLKRQWQDGTQSIVFEPLDFLSELAALVPPPRMHRTRYHGVFAPNAQARREVVPACTTEGPCLHGRAAAHNADETAAGERHNKRYSWAKLLARVWAIDVLSCPKCKAGCSESRLCFDVVQACATPDHLGVEHRRLRRAREDDPFDGGLIVALCEHHAVGEDLDGAGAKVREDPSSLVRWHFAVDCCGSDAGSLERRRDVERGHFNDPDSVPISESTFFELQAALRQGEAVPDQDRSVTW